MKKDGGIQRKLQNYITKHARRGNLVFLIGNGINRYDDLSEDRSWNSLLLRLHNKYSMDKIKQIPQPGLSLTEFYDLILLESRGKATKKEIQKAMAHDMGRWKFGQHHRTISHKIARMNVPILTTNFDSLLANAVEAKKYYTIEDRSKGFTAFYPWQCYYSTKPRSNGEGFSIWHVHGMTDYPQSIRLGLRDMLLAFRKAEKMRPKRREERNLFPGSNTWLKHFMEKSMVVFGQALDESEIFLRWLLIERAKYLRDVGHKKTTGWYVFTNPSRNTEGMRFFLRRIGLETVEFKSRSRFYHDFWNAF